MARITIEDCMEHVPNRFHLVRMASIRAKQLKKGALPLLTSDDNKQIVMSLREIAAGLVKAGTTESAAPDAPSEETGAESSVAAAEAAPAEEAQTEEVASAEEAQTEEVASAVAPDESTPKSEE